MSRLRIDRNCALVLLHDALHSVQAKPRTFADLLCREEWLENPCLDIFWNAGSAVDDFHDYKTAGIDSAVLARWCAEVGWEVLLNRGGTTFRKLPDAQKTGLNERKAISLMLAQPSMIKRPVLELGKHVWVGFQPDVYDKAVGDSR